MNELKNETFFPTGVFDLIKEYAGIDPVKHKQKKAYKEVLKTMKTARFVRDDCCCEGCCHKHYYGCYGLEFNGYKRAKRDLKCKEVYHLACRYENPPGRYGAFLLPEYEQLWEPIPSEGFLPIGGYLPDGY